MARLPGRRSLQTINISVHDDDVELLGREDDDVLHRPSRLRYVTVKLFVFVVFVALALLVATELSIILQKPGLDPRPWLLKAVRWLSASVRSLA